MSEINPAIAKVPRAQISVNMRSPMGRGGGGGGNFISFSISGPT